MNADLDSLHDRLRQLELLAIEFARIERLVDHAASGQNIEPLGDKYVIYVDAETKRIIDVSDNCVEFLGYTKDELLRLSIDDIEIALNDGDDEQRFRHNLIEEQIYLASYRHKQGHAVDVEVYRRRLPQVDRQVLYFRLEDRSLHRRLWFELLRRQDDNFDFQQKLKRLNAVTIDLSRIDSFDELCLQIIRLGIENLGFDRLGMWFLDTERDVMVGSYGVDEQGVIRAEHHQQWAYHNTFIMDFIVGNTEVSLTFEDAPLYNDHSEIIEYGWRIAAPIMHSKRFVGVISADNFIHRQRMKNYEPDLLRLYGITIGHLTELIHIRAQTLNLHLEQEHYRMLKRFVADVGHDFRTPLSVINTNSFLIQRLDDPERRRVLSVGIQQQVQSISKMLDSMLMYIALQNDLELSLMPVDLHALLSEVIDLHHPLSVSRRIKCTFEPEKPAVVAADAGLLLQALSEIYQNALQYTPEGGWVRVSFVEHEGNVGIRIEDNGIGIDRQHIENIFKPLFRVDQARTERRNGLGLAIAKYIVDAHRGRIIVESAPHAGSTFEVILPLS